MSYIPVFLASRMATPGPNTSLKPLAVDKICNKDTGQRDGLVVMLLADEQKGGRD